MPNWCYNKLVIRGPKEDRQRLLNDLKIAGLAVSPSDPPEFTFNAVLPMPEGLKGTRSPRPPSQEEIRANAKEHNWSEENLQWNLEHALTPEEEKRLDALKVEHGHDNWYDWCVANWGTKWDASQVSINAYSNGITICYDTAWSPPEGVIHALAEKYPTLTFRNHYAIEGWPGKDIVIGDATIMQIRKMEREEKQKQINEALAKMFAG